MVLFTDDYLEHHGILGQKWGVRRFQNKDGSLTAAGKKRQASNSKADSAKKKKPEPVADYVRARNKPLSQMTDDDLKNGYNRLKMENLYNAEYQKLHKETPREYVKRVAVSAAKKHGEKVAEYMIGKAINKAFGDEVIKDLGSKKNVEAGKKLFDTMKDELNKAAKGTNDEPSEKKSETLNRAKDTIDKIRSANTNASINAASEYVKTGKRAYDHVKDDYYEETDTKTYYGEPVGKETPRSNVPMLGNLEYDTKKRR